jgi:Domain of unknown function DUF29
MATHARPTDDLYGEDFHIRTEVQADLLRARRYDPLDLEHLIEEVEGLGDANKSAVLSNATVIVEHLLKLQPGARPPTSWIDSVLEHRNRLEYDLTPRLRLILEDELPRAYGRARRTAERRPRAHSEDATAAALPAICPYAPDQITADWWP